MRSANCSVKGSKGNEGNRLEGTERVSWEKLRGRGFEVINVE